MGKGQGEYGTGRVRGREGMGQGGYGTGWVGDRASMGQVNTYGTGSPRQGEYGTGRVRDRESMGQEKRAGPGVGCQEAEDLRPS